VAGDLIYRNAKLSAQIGCHPGSLNRRHSVGTTPDRYRHLTSPLRC
jgi:hypothetical protein